MNTSPRVGEGREGGSRPVAACTAAPVRSAPEPAADPPPVSSPTKGGRRSCAPVGGCSPQEGGGIDNFAITTSLGLFLRRRNRRVWRRKPPQQISPPAGAHDGLPPCGGGKRGGFPAGGGPHGGA